MEKELFNVVYIKKTDIGFEHIEQFYLKTVPIKGDFVLPVLSKNVYCIKAVILDDTRVYAIVEEDYEFDGIGEFIRQS